MFTFFSYLFGVFVLECNSSRSDFVLCCMGHLLEKTNGYTIYFANITRGRTVNTNTYSPDAVCIVVVRHRKEKKLSLQTSLPPVELRYIEVEANQEQRILYSPMDFSGNLECLDGQDTDAETRRETAFSAFPQDWLVFCADDALLPTNPQEQS